MLGEDTDRSGQEGEQGVASAGTQVGVVASSVFFLSSIIPVPDQDRWNPELRVTVSLSKETTDGFGPLKALLGAIVAAYANQKVRPRPPPTGVPARLTPSQESVAVRNKVEVILSRIDPIDALFATPPGNRDEQRRRYDVKRYVIIPPFTISR